MNASRLAFALIAIWSAAPALAAEISAPALNPAISPALSQSTITPPELSLTVKPEGSFFQPYQKVRKWRIETHGGFAPITITVTASDSRIEQANALGGSNFEVVDPPSGTTATSGLGSAPAISQPSLPASTIGSTSIVGAPQPSAPVVKDIRFKGLPEYSVGTGGLPKLDVLVTVIDGTGRKVGARFDVTLTFAQGPPVLNGVSLQGAAPAAVVTAFNQALTRSYSLDLSNWDARDNWKPTGVPDLTRQIQSRIELRYPNGLRYQGHGDLRYTGQLGSPAQNCPASVLCAARIPDLGLGHAVEVRLVNPYGRSEPIVVTIPAPIVEITENENFSLPSTSATTATIVTSTPSLSSALLSADAGTCPQDAVFWKEVVVADPAGRAKLKSGGQSLTQVSNSTMPKLEFAPGPSQASANVTYRFTVRSPICNALVIP